jgi:DNA-binding transcriptional LysR family regulator
MVVGGAGGRVTSVAEVRTAVVAVRDQVGELLRQSRQVLAPSRELDLAGLDRVFTLQCHDALATVLAPALLADVTVAAPGVRLRFLAEAAADTDELRHGRVDLEVGSAVPGLPEIRHEVVGHDRFVVALRAGHPYAQGIDLEGFAADLRRGRRAAQCLDRCRGDPRLVAGAAQPDPLRPARSPRR